jgi:hypothetical protein
MAHRQDKNGPKLRLRYAALNVGEVKVNRRERASVRTLYKSTLSWQKENSYHRHFPFAKIGILILLRRGRR